MSYLLHRHADEEVGDYVKKAAGPYNPKTRCGGAERIALERGYVRSHKCDSYSGFVAGANIIQAEGYFEKWYGQPSINWLQQFRRKKNSYLEVLTTVDMAAEEIRAAGNAVDLDGVRDVLREHPEWNAKVTRPEFADAEIARAIADCRELFGSGGAAFRG